MSDLIAKTRVRLEGPLKDAWGGTSGASARVAAERVICEALGVDLTGARRVLERFPSLLPIAHTETEARELATRLEAAGIATNLVVVPEGSVSHCAIHPRYIEANRCEDCSRVLCLICERQHGTLCPDCTERAARRVRNQRVRVTVLLVLLFSVCFLAVREFRRRYLGWERPHRVAIVVVQDPNAPLSEELAASFAERSAAVEQALTVQRHRYAPGAEAPVSLSVVGPIDELRAPPKFESPGLWDLLQFNLALNQYAEDHDALLGLNDSVYDVRIYVRLSEAQGRLESAEGLGQQRGRVGVVSTQISPDGVDFAWFVTIHEYLHTRGASDKYGSDGRALNPEGYADPEAYPLLPQLGTELTARGRPESSTEEDLPGSPETWVVGKWTAKEIGW